jgi:hypothetical protein
MGGQIKVLGVIQIIKGPWHAMVTDNFIHKNNAGLRIFSCSEGQLNSHQQKLFLMRMTEIIT